LNTISFRPHAGEAGDLDHLAAGVLAHEEHRARHQPAKIARVAVPVLPRANRA
jgi:hypothetical protein